MSFQKYHTQDCYYKSYFEEQQVPMVQIPVLLSLVQSRVFLFFFSIHVRFNGDNCSHWKRSPLICSLLLLSLLLLGESRFGSQRSHAGLGCPPVPQDEIYNKSKGDRKISKGYYQLSQNNCGNGVYVPCVPCCNVYVVSTMVLTTSSNRTVQANLNYSNRPFSIL